MKKIAVITSTRAEFGLLLPVIKELSRFESESFKAELIVTGTHLSKDYGYTIEEIEKTDVRIDHKVRIPVKSDSAVEISKNQAKTLIKFSEIFEKEKYNAIVILGDRYEMLAIAIAAGNTRTPICHLCGGDTTEGAMDEWIRHSISKISYLHFVTNPESYHRVMQLGENPARIFDFGSTSIDNIIHSAYMSKKEALRSVNLSECAYAVCTYHPVTMEKGNFDTEINEFLKAVEYFPDIQFIVTKSNADQGGAHINKLLDRANEEIDNLHVYASLGVVRYLSLIKYSKFVLGNSSSGIIEAPAFHIPVVNIGDRQKGRLQSKCIINSEPDMESIILSIQKALTPEFREGCKHAKSLYGDGNAATQIAKKIFSVVMNDQIDLKKKFYDIEVGK